MTEPKFPDDPVKAYAMQEYLARLGEHWKAERGELDNGDDLTEPDQGLRSRLLYGRDVTKIPEPEPLLRGVIYQPSIVMGYGKAKSGKTFFSQGLAACVATGTSFLGLPVRQGPVLYVAAEGTGGLGKRTDAWCIHHGRNDLEHLVWLPRAVNLMNRAVVNELAAIVAELHPALVVLDTLARCTVGADENSTKDMGQAIDAVDQLRDAADCTVLFDHHTGKDGAKGARGSTALIGAVDTAIEITRDARRLTIRCEAQRDAEPFEPIYARLQDAGPSVVAVPAAVTADDVPASVWAVRDALRDADDGNGLSTTAWKLCCPPEIADRTYYRSKKWLVDHGLVVRTGQRFSAALPT